jgi:hypothetical protein
MLEISHCSKLLETRCEGKRLDLPRSMRSEVVRISTEEERRNLLNDKIIVLYFVIFFTFINDIVLIIGGHLRYAYKYPCPHTTKGAKKDSEADRKTKQQFSRERIMQT